MQPVAILRKKFDAQIWLHPFHQTMEINDSGLVFGAGTMLARMGRNAIGAPVLALDGDEDRLLALLSVAYRQSVPDRLFKYIERASRQWAQGDKCLAHIELAFAALPRLENREDAFCMFLADALIDSGMSPGRLMKELGYGPPSLRIRKYDEHETRVPPGNGRQSGEWAKGPMPGPAPVPVAPRAAAAARSLVGAALSPEALAWLAAVGLEGAGVTAVFGLIFVPSPNKSVVTEGTLPDLPGVRFSLNHDEGLLRFVSEDGSKILGAAHLGIDGLYHEIETGVPIARELADGSVTLIDPDLLPGEVRGEEQVKPQEGGGLNQSGGGKGSGPYDEEPKLCPDEGPDKKGGRRLFDALYQEYVSRVIVNPQREPPLARGLAFSLMNPETGLPVTYDDCRESNGNMIEAKGHYAHLMKSKFYRDFILPREFFKQAYRQFQASGGRHIEWWFHEKETAELAERIFKHSGFLEKISVFHKAYPGGVPKYNPRIQ